MVLVRASLSRLVAFFLATALLLNLAVLASARAAPPDVVSSEYRLPARTDPDIAPDTATEIWARVYRPRVLNRTSYPLVLFLHGNHATCGWLDPSLGVRIDDDTTYTFEGRCPDGYVVTPNHLGYAYLAEGLAGAGYVVVSINANRGINAADGVAGDFGLNLRRGRLVLKHLQLLARWNRGGGTPASLGIDLKGKLDLGQVGLMGHSRGGEGMRAALAQFRDRDSPWPGRIGAGIAFKALYEIAPVDGQTDRVLDALGVAWNVLLPYCDGDVTSLEGVQVFDRMLLSRTEAGKLPKSTFAVWGANHNFYNTEWQQSDSPGCAGHAALFPDLEGSAKQRATALHSVVPFLRAHVGRTVAPSLAALFDPLAALPASITSVTRVDRGYTDTPDKAVELRVDDFDKPTGTSSYGQANQAQGITVEHVRRTRDDVRAPLAASITWNAAGRRRLFQTNWAPPGSGRDIVGYRTLEFRIARWCDEFCESPDPLNSTPTTDLSVQLVRPDGSLSAAVRLADHLALRGPVGYGDRFFAVLHPIPATARVPLDAFGPGVTSIRGVRFTFDRTPTGAVYLANIRLSKRGLETASARAVDVAATTDSADTASRRATVATPVRASIAAIRRVDSADAGARAVGGAVEIEVAADGPLPVTDALPTLRVGSRQFRLSRYPRGRVDRVTFTLGGDEFAKLEEGAPAELRLGASRRFDLGRLDKSALR